MSQSTFPVFSDQCKSLLKKYLNPTIWTALAELSTESGYSFAQLIRSGLEQQDSAVGVYAGDAESYSLFAPLLTPIIHDYHGFSDKHPTADFSFNDLPEISTSAQQRIISTRVRVGRNLSGFAFGPAINRTQRLEVEALIQYALKKLPISIQGEYLPLSDMEESSRKELVERHLLFKSEDRFLTSANLMRDWPEGRGLFLSKDEAFSVWVNEEDQLRIIALKKGGDVMATFRLLAAGVQSLSTHLDFAFNEDIGYLTSCPSNLGTAMRASVHMQLNSLADNTSILKQKAELLGLQIRGVHGEHSASEGGVFDISNRMRLGVTEKIAISHLVNGVNALAEMDIS